jgi:hypothetical protein
MAGEPYTSKGVRTVRWGGQRNRTWQREEALGPHPTWPNGTQHGLLSGSFIPPRDQREVRELTRYRTSLVQERARAVNRLQKTLEETNIKLGDVATDILGESARAMLEGLLAGQSDAEQLAGPARG